MLPPNSSNLAVALGSMRVMKLQVARMLAMWVQKTRMDLPQYRLAVICCDPPFINTGLIAFQDLGLDHVTATWPNLMFF